MLENAMVSGCWSYNQPYVIEEEYTDDENTGMYPTDKEFMQ